VVGDVQNVGGNLGPFLNADGPCRLNPLYVRALPVIIEAIVTDGIEETNAVAKFDEENAALLIRRVRVEGCTTLRAWLTGGRVGVPPGPQLGVINGLISFLEGNHQRASQL